MKNIIKGFSALVLLLVLIVSMAVPALAWTTQPEITVKVGSERFDLVDYVPGGQVIDVERGEELDIELTVDSTNESLDSVFTICIFAGSPL